MSMRAKGTRTGLVALSTLAGTLAVVACADRTAAPLAPERPSFAISDGAHNAGNPHFFFLPPLVENPQSDGTFLAGLSPIIRITDGMGFDITLNADLDSSNAHYHQNWHTDQYDLDPTHTYRISVLVDGTELGYADVDVVSSGSELKNVDTGEYIALKDGRTLPILFRIEEGALGGGEAFFAVTTEVPVDELSGDVLAAGSLEFTVCESGGSPCPHDGAALAPNATTSFTVDPGTWEYAMAYVSAGLEDSCEADALASDPLSDTRTLADGETVALTLVVSCSGL